MIEKSFLLNKDKWFYDLFTWKGSIKNQVYVPPASHPPWLKDIVQQRYQMSGNRSFRGLRVVSLTTSSPTYQGSFLSSVSDSIGRTWYTSNRLNNRWGVLSFRHKLKVDSMQFGSRQTKVDSIPLEIRFNKTQVISVHRKG